MSTSSVPAAKTVPKSKQRPSQSRVCACRSLRGRHADLRAPEPRVRERRGRLADLHDAASAISISAAASPSTRSATRIPSWSRRSPSRPASCGTAPISTASPARSAWPSGCARRRSPTRCSSAIRARRPARAPSSWRGAITSPTAIPSAGASSPSRAPSTAARWRPSPPPATRSTWKASASRRRGFDHRAVRRSRGGARRPSARRRRPSWSSRCRARAASASPPSTGSRRCASCATSTGCCWCSTRCNAAWAAPASCSPTSGPASTPDVMAVAKGIGGGFPLGAFLATDEAAKGMVAGTHGSTYRRQSAGHGGRQRRARRRAGAGLPRARAGHGAAPEAGAGPPQGREPATSSRRCAAAACWPASRSSRRRPRWSTPCMAEKLLTVGAGENVVRLLPPLNVTEAEIGEAVTRLSRALQARCPSRPPDRLSPMRRMRRHGAPAFSRYRSHRRRHPAAHPRHGARHEEGRQARAGQAQARRHRRRRADADLREAVDAHARVLRRGHAPARAARPWRSTTPTCRSAAASPSPTRPRCSRAMSTRS